MISHISTTWYEQIPVIVSLWYTFTSLVNDISVRLEFLSDLPYIVSLYVLTTYIYNIIILFSICLSSSYSSGILLRDHDHHEWIIKLQLLQESIDRLTNRGDMMLMKTPTNCRVHCSLDWPTHGQERSRILVYQTDNTINICNMFSHFEA